VQNRASIVENPLQLAGEGSGNGLFRERYGRARIRGWERMEKGARWKSGAFHVEHWRRFVDFVPRGTAAIEVSCVVR
jgi:hypothetical protein